MEARGKLSTEAVYVQASRYVVHGALFDLSLYEDGTRMYAIHKIFLFDPRFADTRRETSFDRLKDDWGKVQGVLALKVMPE